MLKLDHLAVASETLEEGRRWTEAQLGVAMQPGGQHVRYGTHNLLLGLGDIYLEVIAPDPEAAPCDGPRWFDLDNFSGPPRLANWICQTDVFDPVAGPPRRLNRGDLQWQLTVPDDGSLPYGGGFPTLIQWGQGATHPAAALPDSGCRLIRLEISHPDAGLAALVDIDDPRVHFVTGNPGFHAVFDTPDGQRSLT